MRRAVQVLVLACGLPLAAVAACVLFSLAQLREVTDEQRATLYWLMLASVTALAAGLLLAWRIGGHIARTVTALAESASALASGAMPAIPKLHFDEANQLRTALLNAASGLNRTQSNLHECDQQLALAARAARFGVWIRDLVHKEISVSDQWRALFDFPQSRPVTLADVLDRVHPDDRAAVGRTFGNLHPAEGQYSMEYRVQLPGGGQRWIASNGSVEYDEGGRALRVRGIAFDITQRKQAELDLQQKKEEIMRLSRVTMLGELSGALAHELNQPLAAILSNAQAAQRFLAKDQVDLAELRAILGDIVDEDRRAGEVIRRMRGLLMSGQVQPQAVDLNRLVSEVEKLMRGDLIAHGIELRLECAPDLASVQADPVQLQQVLINLLLNACDAMQDGAQCGRRIVVCTGRYGDGEIGLCVIDQGSGIPAADLERIFEAFYTTKAHGMGLGLSICRNIVEAHGGRLWGSNNPGRGASIHLRIPLRA